MSQFYDEAGPGYALPSGLPSGGPRRQLGPPNGSPGGLPPLHGLLLHALLGGQPNRSQPGLHLGIPGGAPPFSGGFHPGPSTPSGLPGGAPGPFPAQPGGAQPPPQMHGFPGGQTHPLLHALASALLGRNPSDSSPYPV